MSLLEALLILTDTRSVVKAVALQTVAVVAALGVVAVGVLPAHPRETLVLIWTSTCTRQCAGQS